MEDIAIVQKGKGKIAGYIGAAVLGGAIAFGSIYLFNKPDAYRLDLDKDGIQDLAVSVGIPGLERNFFYLGQKDGSFKDLSEIDEQDTTVLEAFQRKRINQFNKKLEDIR